MENIIFRRSWFKTLKRWKPEQVSEFINACYAILEDQPVEIQDEGVMTLWDQAEPLLKSDKEKYIDRVKANQENGKLGGRPKKTETNPRNPIGFLETQPNPQNLKEKEKEKEKDKEKEKEIDKEKDNNSTIILGGFDKGKFYKKYKSDIEAIRTFQSCSLDDAIDYKLKELEELSLQW
jgi:hypothetical protein